MENVSHKLNMQIEANFKEDFFEEEQGVVEKYFFHGDVLLTLKPEPCAKRPSAVADVQTYTMIN